MIICYHKMGDFDLFMAPFLLVLGVALWLAVISLWYILSVLLKRRGWKDLLSVPVILLAAYGIFAFVYPSVASVFTPEKWEWPVPGRPKALVLSDGRLAVAVDNVGRVQIYSPEGKYLTGWFLPIYSNHPDVLGTGQDYSFNVEPDTIMVQVSRSGQLILYDPEGSLIRQDPIPEKFDSVPKGHLKEYSFASPCYKWPLTHPLRGWLIFMIIFIPSGLIAHHRKKYKTKPTLVNRRKLTSRKN